MSTSPAPTPPHATNTTSPPPPATNSTSPTQPATNTASLPPATPAPSTSLSPPQSLPTGVTIVGMVIGGVLITLVIILGRLFFYFKKKVYHCPLPDGPYDLQPQHWQPNTPQPGSHAVNIPPIPSPPHAAMSPIPSTRVTFVSSERRFTFTYEELAKATDGFSKANVLGQGGFGYVYKGILPNGEEVAIKQLKEGSHQGDREFQAEVEIISRVHHRNLVTLVGYCIAGSHRILVYDFVPNNTLEFHLHSRGRPNMDWPTRLRSALGAAKGLAYLHEDCDPKIIHRDIKSANILLDFNFEAKVADFGLAKQCSSNTGTHISTKPMGTFGYLAPEYASKGILTEKVDVYSFGVMLLELITGRKALFSSPSSPPSSEKESLVDWARPLLPQALEEENFDGLVDPRLPNEYNHNEMLRMINCAACCVRLSAQHRPQMSQVVLALEGRLSLSNRDAEILGHNTASISHDSSDYDTSRARTMLGPDGTTLYVSFG